MSDKKTQKDILSQYIRIKNPNFDGVADSLRRLDYRPDEGIDVLYSDESDRVQTFLFDKDVWTDAEADAWVKENSPEDKQLHTTAQIKERTSKGMLAIASDEVEDRDGDVISVDGWDFTAYKQNPVLLWQHNRAAGHSGLPIGKATKIRRTTIDGKKVLTFEPVFDDSTAFNRTVKKMVEEKGLLNTFSVGFLGKEKDGDRFTKQELLEISLVPVPSNARATFVRRAAEIGVEKTKAMEFVDIKSTVPFREYPPAPESANWDSGAAKSRVSRWAGGPDKEDIEWGRYKEAFTWYDPDGKEELGGYKLPHHDVQGGRLVTVWSGVVAAMAALLGARGGVDLPDSDRKSVYNHLAKHYEQFDKVPPDFKFVESQELKELFDIYTEHVKEKTFKEYKKMTQSVKRLVKEVRKDRQEQKRKAAEKRKADSELVKALALKAVDKKITKFLKESTSHRKGGKK